MPAKSKKQQRFFALVRACQDGRLKHPSEHLKEVASRISKEDAHDFAATKHKGLPEKAAEWLRMFKEGSLLSEVDPSRRMNIDRRALKVLERLLEPEDSEEESSKMKRKVEETARQDKETLQAGFDALSDVLSKVRSLT